jgi:hypothetical protein
MFLSENCLVNIKRQIYYVHRQIFFLIFFTTGAHYLPTIKCRLGVIWEVLLNMQCSDPAHNRPYFRAESNNTYSILWLCVYILNLLLYYDVLYVHSSCLLLINRLCSLPTCLYLVHLVTCDFNLSCRYLPTYLTVVVLVNQRVLIIVLLAWWQGVHPTKLHAAYL